MVFCWAAIWFCRSETFCSWAAVIVGMAAPVPSIQFGLSTAPVAAADRPAAAAFTSFGSNAAYAQTMVQRNVLTLDADLPEQAPISRLPTSMPMAIFLSSNVGLLIKALAASIWAAPSNDFTCALVAAEASDSLAALSSSDCDSGTPAGVSVVAISLMRAILLSSMVLATRRSAERESSQPITAAAARTMGASLASPVVVRLGGRI